MGGVEGEGFAAAGLAVAGFLNASDFVVNVMEDAASLVGALNQVAGFVVGVGKGMAQRVGAFERQSVHCEFVGGFG